MSKVAFTHVDPTGRFTFHAPDGTEITVADRFETDDPGLVAYLDQVPFVKRSKAKEA